jgi:pimeloyl-ACP methyl ester carboxylesterase
MNKTLKIFFMCFSIVLLLVGCGKKGEEPVNVAEKETEPTIIVDNAISPDGVSIAYEVRGEGEPTLVFVHGWCCDRSYWKEQLPHFVEKYKVVAIDLAGHGESGLERDDFTMAAFGEDVASVVEKLSLRYVILIGHSMGDKVILEAARRIPKHVIGLVGADTFNDDTKIEQVNELLVQLRGNFHEITRSFVRSMFPPTADSGLVEKVVADTSSAPSEIGLSAVEEYYKHDLTLALKDLDFPIRTINSDMNPTELDVIHRYAPSFKVMWMSGVGHFVMMEDPETFNRLLEETIQEFIQMKELE